MTVIGMIGSVVGVGVGVVAAPSGAGAVDDTSIITISDAEAREGDALEFRITRTDTSRACTLTFQTNPGTATELDDFLPSDGSFLMAVDDADALIVVPTFPSVEVEPLESLTISVSAHPSEYCVLANSTATGVILADPSNVGPLQPPTNASASSIGADIDVTWNSFGTNADEFLVARYRWNGSAWVYDNFLLLTSDAAMIDSNVDPGRYYYDIRSTRNSETSDPAIATVVHSAGLPVLPDTPVAVSLTSSNANVVFDWNPSSGVFGYELLRARYRGGAWTDWTVLPVVDAVPTSYTDHDVAPGIYAYLVRSYNAAGSSDWAVLTISHPTGTAPAMPDGFTSFSEFGVAQLQWEDVAAESYYELVRLRYDAGANSWVEPTSRVLDADTVVYIDDNVPAGRYAYLLRAVNGAGASSWSIQVTGVDTSGNVPAVPTGLTLTPSGGGMSVTWVDNATDEWGYELLRARWDGTDWVDWTARAFDRNATTYLDAPLTPGSYAYLVRAFNGNGASAWEIFSVELPAD